MALQGFDRSKFRDTTDVSKLKENDDKIDKINKQAQKGYAGYLTIEDGENKFRIYPPHPNEENHPFVQPKQLWWLPWKYEKKDDNGNVIKDKKGQTIIQVGRKRIFDGRIHSATEKDIVHEYIEFLEKVLKEQGFSDDEVTEKMLPVTGSYQKKIQGIVGKPGWVIYAEKHTKKGVEFGRLEMGKAVKFRLNELIARENADEPIGTQSVNPFTHLDDGRLMIVTYNSEASKANDYYKTEIDSSFDSKTKMINLYPLSDDQLETFAEFPSLRELFVDVYTTKDFEMAVEGLKIFDEENKFGVFEFDEFNDILSEFSQIYPEPKEDGESEDGEKKPEKKAEQPKQAPKATGGKTLKEELPEEEEDDSAASTSPDFSSGDQFDSLDRNELKIYIRDNAIPVVVKKSMEDEDIRDAIREHVKAEDASEEIEEEEDEPTQLNEPTAKSSLREKYGKK